MRILFLSLLFMSSACLSDSLSIGLMTKHFLDTGTRGFNEDNSLIGYSMNKYEIGTFYNSYETRSFYAARRFEYNNKFGAMVGMVSGYNFYCMAGDWSCRESDIIPALSVHLNLTDNISIVEFGNALMLVLKIPIEVK